MLIFCEYQNSTKSINIWPHSVMCFIYRTHIIQNLLLQSIQFHPRMAVERAGQLIINILDFKYIFFLNLKPMANAPNGKKASLTLILVMFTVCVFVFCPSSKKWNKWNKWKIWGPPCHQRIERIEKNESTYTLKEMKKKKIFERFEGPCTLKEMKEMKDLRVPTPSKK